MDNPSEEQFEVLSKIIKGEAKGSAFDAYSATVDQFE